jgi:hypothetical protein
MGKVRDEREKKSIKLGGSPGRSLSWRLETKQQALNKTKDWRLRIQAYQS